MCAVGHRHRHKSQQLLAWVCWPLHRQQHHPLLLLLLLVLLPPLVLRCRQALVLPRRQALVLRRRQALVLRRRQALVRRRRQALMLLLPTPQLTTCHTTTLPTKGPSVARHHRHSLSAPV